MSDKPLDLDLKILPDWMKEPAGKNPYADFEGERPERPRRGNQPGGRRDPRSGPGRDFRGPRKSHGSQGTAGGHRGNRPDRGSQGAPGTHGARPPKPGRRDERPGKAGSPHAHRPRPERQPEVPEQPEVPLQVEFLPREESISALIQQIQTSHRAFPFYGTGRMFLNKPERHQVRITSLAPAFPLYPLGKGVTLNRAQAEREAFRTHRATYYQEETTETEPPKGNFTSVARCRISGTLLGPTNHHGYQTALRRLYESRFSRRSSFQDFQRQIEIVTDPAVVETWKQEASRVTVYRTLKEAEPVEFKTLAEVEAHFRARYLAEAVKPELSVTLDGPASRTVQDRTIREAIRAAWEKERTFPAQLVNLIRPYFNTANLHVWKHRKRILFVSEVRPTRFNPEAQSVSEPIANLLRTIEENPKITRNGLSEKLLKPRESEADYEQLKTALAADLHWLIRAGHVIEFHDGTLDLPLPPKETGSPSKPTAPTAAAAEAESPATPETTPAAGADLGESAEELTTVPEPATPDASATPSVPAEAEEAALPKEEAAPDASLEAEQKSQDQGA